MNNKRVLIVALAGAAALVIVGCGCLLLGGLVLSQVARNPSNSIVGEWTTLDDPGMINDLEFLSDGQVHGVLGGGYVVSGKYEVIDSTHLYIDTRLLDTFSFGSQRVEMRLDGNSLTLKSSNRTYRYVRK